MEKVFEKSQSKFEVNKCACAMLSRSCNPPEPLESAIFESCKLLGVKPFKHIKNVGGRNIATDAQSKGWGDFVDWTEDAADDVVDWTEEAAASLKDWVEKAGASMVKEINKMGEKIKNFAEDVGKDILKEVMKLVCPGEDTGLPTAAELKASADKVIRDVKK